MMIIPIQNPVLNFALIINSLILLIISVKNNIIIIPNLIQGCDENKESYRSIVEAIN